MKDSKEKKANLLIIYYFLFFLIHYFHWVFKNISFILEQLLRQIESFLYMAFILEKNEEVEDQVFTNRNKNNNENKDLEMSFNSIKKRENNELNEAGQFINIELPVLMSSNSENS